MTHSGGVTGRGLNSGGEGLQLTDFSLSYRACKVLTTRNSLNWLFGVSCTVFMLSSCIFWGGGVRLQQCLWGSNRGLFYVDFPGS